MKKSITILLFTLFAIFIPVSMVSSFQETPLSSPISVLFPALLLMSLIVLFLENRVAGYLFSLLAIYLVSAVVFTMELLNFNETQSNEAWFSQHYTFKMFKFEFFLFSPIIYLFYLLSMIVTMEFKNFSYEEIFQEMEILLSKNGTEFFTDKGQQ